MNAKELTQLATDIASTQQCIEDLERLAMAITEKQCRVSITVSAKIENPDPIVTIGEDGSLNRSDQSSGASILARVLGLEQYDQNDQSRPIIGGLRDINESMALSVIGGLIAEAKTRLESLKMKLAKIR